MQSAAAGLFSITIPMCRHSQFLVTLGVSRNCAASDIPASLPLHAHNITYKHDARLTTMTVDPFNMIELVEDLKGIILPQPFKHRFAGGKNHADRYSADTAYPAYILVSQQLKYMQRCSAPFHSDLTT